MMAIQMIFCLETNKRVDTDGFYIRSTINQYYVINNRVKISLVYMDGKGNYASKRVLNEIVKKTKDFTIGETKVFYCIDTDDFEINQEQENLSQQIESFCGERGYELIWFCRDVEEVYWGERVSKSQKVEKAKRFKRTKEIERLDTDRLLSSTKKHQTSNILTVLDGYLSRRKLSDE